MSEFKSRAEASDKNTGVFLRGFLKPVNDHKWLYIFVIPGFLWMVVFCFVPMFALVMAFQNFSPYNGTTMIGAFVESPFVGFSIFKTLFTGPDFLRILKNTLTISIFSLIFYFPAPIILALLLNEIRSYPFKRITQTIVYIPHFISWVIVATLTAQMFNTSDGIILHLLKEVMGRRAPDIMSNPKLFVPMIIGQSMWKETGYGTIIYLAALASVDVQLYEAAVVDGANRFQKLWHITLPGIRGTIIIMFILKLGQVMNTGYEQIFLMQNSMNRSVSDVFDTYIYTRSVVNGNYSLGTAAGLFKSFVGMFMVIASNRFAKRFGESGLY
ncbi:ABC transporter permease [Parasphaerochaeta coccoides]|uniref:Carbohydrate ABC transporter membrane protein 1, CUT1 family n=1 Tax=Parasphaerochaeta coccoides (strain ATCC BAA-1237 / DSM 17374 / SPN1) TaxID=760011 RepID=F4GIW9_PARC1|nr:ABC transporter permease subunit [Parasphaerochaeta coccoides]AEC02737.1 carbohydrate ABC transporter membrane protein 1, CUT1 family [Parasphaerochaeta coccoides DSM 17374]